MPSRRSSARRSPGRRRSALPLDVYLLPSVVGAGRGDVEEVLTIGRRLADAGFRPQLLRLDGRPLPRGVDGSYDWPRVRRRSRIVRTARRALTVSSQFGVTAEQRRTGPMGAPGPWAPEVAAIESAYGPGAVLHVSLEEFGRARPVTWLARERWREAGRAGRGRPKGGGRRSQARDRATFARLYRRFRSFDRTNLIALFPGFCPSSGFAREFPESVQCGPLEPWPTPAAVGPARRARGARRHVIWYASPSSSERIAPSVVEGLARTGLRIRLSVSSPRPLPIPHRAGVEVERSAGWGSGAWRQRWREADLAITTGSRSLLEALARGVPFLYFNGILGSGRRTRRHRPEKLLGLLARFRQAGVADRVRSDLGRFGSGRGVADVVARALTDPVWRRAVRLRPVATGYAPGFGEAGRVVERLARELSVEGANVAEIRARAGRASRRTRGVSKV